MTDKQIHNPGNLRKRIEVQKPVEKTDAAGGTYTDYVTDFLIWAAKTPNNGQRVFRSAQYEHEVDGLIETRYRDDITVDHRLKEVSNGNILNIEAIFDATGEKRRLSIAYVEVM